jgi:DNA polymerase-3 subunit beta
MKLTINRRSFSEQLQTAFGVASRGKDVLASVKVIVCKTEGRYAIHASNSEIGMVLKGQPVSLSAGQCLLPPKALSILKESSDDEMTIEATSTEVKIEGQSARFSLPSKDPAEFPSVKELTEGCQFDLPAEGLRRIASQVAYAVDEESTRYQLGGVLFSVGDDLHTVATDGRRLACLKIETQGGKTATGIVPAKALRTVASAIGDGVATVTLSQSQAMFRGDSVALVTPLVEGRFPAWQGVIPPDQDPIAIPAGPWSSVVRQASIVADNESRGIELAISDGTLSMAARTADVGSSSVQMVVATDRKIKTTIDHRFLAEFLRSVDPSAMVDVHLSEPDRPVKLVAGDLICVIMPMSKR